MGCSNSSTKEAILYSNPNGTENNNNNNNYPDSKSNDVLILNKNSSPSISKQSSFQQSDYKLRKRSLRSKSTLRVNKRKISEYPMQSFQRKSTLIRSDKKSFTTRKQESLRKTERNGFIMVENIKEYLPQDITEEMVYEMVEQALGGSVVDDESKVEKGKTITRKQLKAIAEVVFQHLKQENNTIIEEVENENKKQEDNTNNNNNEANNNNEVNNNNEGSNNNNEVNNNNNVEEEKKQSEHKFQRSHKVRHSCINDLYIRVGMRNLTPSLLKKTYFRNQNVSQTQLDNAMKNFTQGTDNVKVLIIDIQ
jgi:hypothetical protein